MTLCLSIRCFVPARQFLALLVFGKKKKTNFVVTCSYVCYNLCVCQTLELLVSIEDSYDKFLVPFYFGGQKGSDVVLV